MKDAERMTYETWQKVHGLFWRGKPEEAKREIASYGRRCYREGVEMMQEAACQAIGEDSEDWMLSAVGKVADRLLEG